MFREKKHKVPERIILGDDGFELYEGADVQYRVRWSEVDRIEVYKEDLITFDMVCMEFISRSQDTVFPVNDEVEGFWDLVERVKVVLPASRQEWETVVIKPAFARNSAVVYERGR